MSAVSFSNPPQHFNPAIAFCGGAGAPSNPQGRLFLFVHLVTVYKSKCVWYSSVAPLNKWHRGWDPTFTWRLCRLSSETRCLRPVVFHYSIFVQLKLNKENVLSYFYWWFITVFGTKLLQVSLAGFWSCFYLFSHVCLHEVKWQRWFH